MQKLLVLFPCLLTIVLAAQNNNLLIPYREGMKWGYADTSGRVVIQPEYKSAEPFHYLKSKTGNETGEGLAIVEQAGQQWVINTAGKTIIPPGYFIINYVNRAGDFIYHTVYGNTGSGLYKNGKMVVPAIYEDIQYLAAGIFKVKKEGKYGLCDGAGHFVADPKYDDLFLTPFIENGYYHWKLESRGKIVKVKGPPAPSAEKAPMVIVHRRSYPYDETMIKFRHPQTLEQLRKDLALDTVIPEFFPAAYLVKKDGKEGILLNEKQLFLFDTVYKEPWVFYVNMDTGSALYKTWHCQCLLLTRKNGKYGIINEKEEVIADFVYDDFGDETDFIELYGQRRADLFIIEPRFKLVRTGYRKISSSFELPLPSGHSFRYFLVESDTGYGYIGENGVEYIAR